MLGGMKAGEWMRLEVEGCCYLEILFEYDHTFRRWVSLGLAFVLLSLTEHLCCYVVCV